MNYIAKVAVDLSLDREFDYRIPDELISNVEIGSRVSVPFGHRHVDGFVVGLTDHSDLDELKPISKVLGEKSLVTEPVMELARWMSSYYLAPFENCVRSVLPAVVRRKSKGEKKQLMVSLNVDATFASVIAWASRSDQEKKRGEDPASTFCLNELDLSQPVSHPSGGNLPHWRQGAEIYFVTFRLADSLPKAKLKQWQQERDLWLEENPKPVIKRDEEIAPTQGNVDATFASVIAWAPRLLQQWQHEYRERFTERIEKWLDVGSGDCILQAPEVRTIVEESLRNFCNDRYFLHSYVIMPNHVHVLVTPLGKSTLSKIIQGWKSFSTREINKARGTSGSVWQKESFDHIVWNPESLEKFKKYIDENPAGLNDDSYALYNRERDAQAITLAKVASTLTDKQQNVIDVLHTASPMLLSELTAAAEVSAATVKSLEKKGLVTISSESIYRDPHEGVEILKTAPLNLMPEQAAALEKVIAAMDSGKPETVLLHGVTGSGKTEVYLQAIARALEQGKGAIVLVPEIALTPQTVDRFRARFADQPERVAVLHSSLSDGERYDEWHRIRSGEATIVIGARSALFAPVENLGLIVVDEEHEPTYKQDEAPRYSARDAAVMRGHRENCAVVLGSATPALESYCNAKSGKYTYVDMPSRVDNRKMPQIRVVDMRLEKDRDGQHGLFSKELVYEIRARLDRAEQTMIFLNRRGFSASLVCPDCGYVSECEHCSVKLTYHKARRRLICHTCGDERAAPDRCPECKSTEFKYSGAGTEKIEEVMAKLFPKANIARMDSDTMRKKNAHRELLAKFRLGKIDILIGTQMIAKGLDFPNVTLVGVVNPDHALHMADFRAGERVFQLLTQVAGRAGRGQVEGEVLVQTYTPHHPAIQFARRMDFEGFCDQELAFRKELFYPPYAHLTCITLRGKNETQVEKTAETLSHYLEQCVSENIMLSPPTPAPISRARGEYRYQILMRAEKTGGITRAIRRSVSAIKKWPNGVKCTIDVDATSLL